MSYSLPQTTVFPEANLLPTQSTTTQLQACIVGGNAALFRYTASSEKPGISLGAYVPGANMTYNYPGKPVSGVVDHSYVKLIADNALLEYWNDTVTPVNGYANQIRSVSLAFARNVFNNTIYDRSTGIFHDRDCAVGDIVDISGSTLDGAFTLRTAIAGFVGEPVAASHGLATADTNNTAYNAPLVAAGTISQTAGYINLVHVHVNASSYDGLADGDEVQTYTVSVITPSHSGLAETATIRVRSANGHDDSAADFHPAAFGVATAIGSKGATITFNIEHYTSLSLDMDTEGHSQSFVDLLVGQTWTVAVRQAFTKPDIAASGTYTGIANTTYVVRVVRGGTISVNTTTCPQITATTTTGVDVGAIQNVIVSGGSVIVGTKGLRIAFTGTKLNAGDLYYIPATAAGEGARQTIKLTKNLPAAVGDVNVTLYIPAGSGIEIPYESLTPGEYNYMPTSTDVAVYSGIQLQYSSWTSSNTHMPLDLAEATLYLEYRAWLQDKVGTLNSVTTVIDLDNVPGQVHPDNPLKYALVQAITNGNGTPVLFMAVGDPSSKPAWTYACNKLIGKSTVYGIVPLTQDIAILTDFQLAVITQSSPEVGRRCVLWTSLDVPATQVCSNAANSENGNELNATVASDGVTVTVTNGKFLSQVRIGDIMRYNYSNDAWSVPTYNEYVIESVTNDDTLVLMSGQAVAPQAVGQKMEVWRTLTEDDLVAALQTRARSYNNERIRAVWPDTIDTSEGYNVPGYFLCAALAALRAGVAPQQSLTGVEVVGFADTGRTEMLGRSQLDALAGAGIWLVTQMDDGTIITRHGITSAGYGVLQTQEEMIVSNTDSILGGIGAVLDQVRGASNVAAASMQLLNLAILGQVERYKQVFIPRLGGQLIDGEVTAVRQHTLFADTVVVDLILTLPAPMNSVKINGQLVIGQGVIA